MRFRRHVSAFAITGVVTLGVGVGLFVAMLSVHSAVIANPIASPEADRLVAAVAVNRSTNFVAPTFSFPKFEFLKAATTSYEHLTAYSRDTGSVIGPDYRPEQVRMLRVSPGFFQMLRVDAALGRLFSPTDADRNAAKVCLLSYEYWIARFGGRDVTGSTIVINQISTEIVGILPPRLSLPWADRQLFVPRVDEDSTLSPAAIANGTATYLELVGRLRNGVSRQQAEAEMATAVAGYRESFSGRSDASTDVQLRTLAEHAIGDRAPTVLTLIAATAAVLLVCCVNLGALFLSRLASRQREIATRQALGASRPSLILHFTAESVVVSLLGGAAGLIVATVALPVLQSQLAAHLPAGLSLQMNHRAFVWAAVLSVSSSVVFGLGPAIYITRPTQLTALRVLTRGMTENAGTQRFRATLVVAETALSVFLLITSGLLLMSFVRLQSVPAGFRVDGTAVASVTVPTSVYGNPARLVGFFSDVLDNLRSRPGVKTAAIAFGLPFQDDNYVSGYAIAGRPLPPPAERARAGLRMVTEGYFEAMGVQLLEGRFFHQADRLGQPGVCIINASLSRRLFGTESPLGKTVLRGTNADQAFEIVGVVADLRTNGLRDPAPDEIFYPFRQMPRASAALVVHVEGEASVIAKSIEGAVSAVDPTIPVSQFATMRQRLNDTLQRERVLATLSAAFAGAAVLLACIGIYALIVDSVRARVREIGVRLAVGASQRHVVYLVVRRSIGLIAGGLVLGVTLAASTSSVMVTQLHDVQPLDPSIYVLMVSLFATVGLTASLLPALRAARIDPTSTLRN